MKYVSLYEKGIMTAIFCLFLMIFAPAQTIKGRVISSNKVPIESAVVKSPNKNEVAAITNKEGAFSILNATAGDTLVVEAVGFEIKKKAKNHP